MVHPRSKQHNASPSPESAVPRRPPPDAVPPRDATHQRDHGSPPPASPPPAPPKVDEQADAFAKFFKRVGKDTIPLDPEKMAALSLPPPAAPIAEPPAEPSPEDVSVKDTNEEKVAVAAKEPTWPRRSEPKKQPAEKTEEPRPSPKVGFGLPPPGTVTKPKQAGAESPAEPPPPEDDEKGNQDCVEVSPLEHRFVGLVIGKAGETIKSFKRQSGASIEIDQNLPEGVPRAVIYRGTRRQVASAKKLVDGLVQRAKEDEKSKSSGGGPPVGGNTGIMGRGPAGPDREKETTSAEKERADEAARADLPPWRRGKLGEEEQRTQGVEARPLRNNNNRRDAPWSKREKECEAAPWGSLTGSLTGEAKLSMRPAWMKPAKQAAEADDGGAVGAFDKTVWLEQKYSRSLLLQAKQKILKMKAYEVPGEMMTMTTGPRPRWKPDRRDRDGGGTQEEPSLKDDAPTLGGRHDSEDREQLSKPVPARDEEEPSAVEAPATETASTKDAEEAAGKKAQQLSSADQGGGPYENMPGDSKDILKLKKKLREIQKIEDSISAGEIVEPNQREKVTKKVGYLEELRLLESIGRQGSV